jgi:hypothetical protein
LRSKPFFYMDVRVAPYVNSVVPRSLQIAA